MSLISEISILLAITVTCFAAPDPWRPKQADLDAALVYAEAQWGSHADVFSIRFGDLSGCVALGEGHGSGKPCAGWSDIRWNQRAITISESIEWTPAYLRAVVTHEYGHILRGSQTHSLDVSSIMYWIVYKNGHQKVTEQDRLEMLELVKRERPTILSGR